MFETTSLSRETDALPHYGAVPILGITQKPADFNAADWPGVESWETASPEQRSEISRKLAIQRSTPKITDFFTNLFKPKEPAAAPAMSLPSAAGTGLPLGLTPMHLMIGGGLLVAVLLFTGKRK
jgi:hypothetical protein